MKCWGPAVCGGLGLGSTSPHGNAPGTMGDNLPAVDVGAGGTVKAISVGGSHSCAILDDDTLKCWGENRSGQLGLGDTNIRGDQPGEMGDDAPAIRPRHRSHRDRSSAPGTVTLARCWTTAPPSAGGSVSMASSGSATPRIAATRLARWATTSRPSTLGPAERPRRFGRPPAHLRRSRRQQREVLGRQQRG